MADDGDELVFYPLNGLTLGDVFANARGSDNVPFCISQEGVRLAPSFPLSSLSPLLPCYLDRYSSDDQGITDERIYLESKQLSISFL